MEYDNTRKQSEKSMFDRRNSDREEMQMLREDSRDNTGIDRKMNELLTMVKDVRENMHYVERKVNSQDQKYDTLLMNSAAQINESVQRTITDTLARQERENRERLDGEIDRKVKLCIDRQVEQNVVSRVDNAINKLNNRMSTEIERVVQDKVQIVNDLHRQNVEGIVDQRIEGHLDEFRDSLWRQKNLLIVNLPESRNPDIKARMNYNMDEVYRIFNLFVEFRDSDVETMPVRLGRISDKPRLLRVTLKSELMLNTIVNKAREQNHLLNPYERDPRKKIYINKDYSEKERIQRKKAVDEKKERERNGETNLEIRRGKVVVKGQYGNQGQQRPTDTYQDNVSQNRMQMQNMENERPRPKENLGASNGLDQTYQTALRNYQESNLSFGTNSSNNSRPNIVQNRPQPQRLDNVRSRSSSATRQSGDYRQNYSNNPMPNQSQTQMANNQQPTQRIFNNQNQIHQTDDNRFRSPLNRDEQGPYIRGESGRQIRGAEGGRSPPRDRSELGRGTDRDNYRDNHNRIRGRSTDRNGDRNEFDYNERDRHERGLYRSGRVAREASRQYNRNQPGSRPYGDQYFGQR